MTAQRIAVCVGLLIALVVAWKLLYPVYTYRFRLTVEVQKDGVTRSGSSVIELRTGRYRILSKLEAPEWWTSVRGEAVFVDLGGGDHLIALLTGGSEPGSRTAALPSRAILGDKLANAGPPGVLDTLSSMHPQVLREAAGRSFVLNSEQMPPLVRFKRLDDPGSVERVEPAAGSVRARIEITRDQVGGSIHQRLPWLGRFKPDKSLTGNGRSVSLFRAGEKPFSKPTHLTYSNFSREH